MKFPRNENNPLYNKILIQKLLSYGVRINQIRTLTELRSYFHKLRTTLFNGSCPDVYAYLMFERVATPQTIIDELDLPQATIYRSLKHLSKNDLIEVISTAPSRNGGRRSLLYAVPEYEPDDVQRALDKEHRRQTPYFNTAKKMSQLIMEEYLQPKQSNEVTKIEIFKIIKEQPKTGFIVYDVVNETCQILARNGVRVYM